VGLQLHTLLSAIWHMHAWCGVQAWDKDMVTDDDVIGRATWTFNPREVSSWQWLCRCQRCEH